MLLKSDIIDFISSLYPPTVADDDSPLCTPSQSANNINIPSKCPETAHSWLFQSMTEAMNKDPWNVCTTTHMVSDSAWRVRRLCSVEISNIPV